MTVIITEDPITPAELDQAWDAWDLADGLFPWTPGTYDAVAAAAQALKDTLELYEQARDGGWGNSPSLCLLVEQVARDIPGQVEALADAIGPIGDETAGTATGRQAA